MLHSRRESLHRNGITDLDLLQQTSATKSAQSRRAGGQPRCLLSGVARTCRLGPGKDLDCIQVGPVCALPPWSFGVDLVGETREMEL